MTRVGNIYTLDISLYIMIIEIKEHRCPIICIIMSIPFESMVPAADIILPNHICTCVYSPQTHKNKATEYSTLFSKYETSTYI